MCLKFLVRFSGLGSLTLGMSDLALTKRDLSPPPLRGNQGSCSSSFEDLSSRIYPLASCLRADPQPLEPGYLYLPSTLMLTLQELSLSPLPWACLQRPGQLLHLCLAIEMLLTTLAKAQ